MPRLVTLADEEPIIVSPMLRAFYLSQLILLGESLSRRFYAASSLMNLRVQMAKMAEDEADVEGPKA
jgi:hypothetical protein